MIAVEDQRLQCRDCGAEFLFCVGEQEFYQSRGFFDDVGRIIAPTRCLACRHARKRTRAERLNSYQ